MKTNLHHFYILENPISAPGTAGNPGDFLLRVFDQIIHLNLFNQGKLEGDSHFGY